MRYICYLLIGFYKRFISPSLGTNCRYTPTCSMYALDSIKKWGVVRGIGMGTMRILRCTPFHKGGFDPVPENYKGKIKWLI